MNLEFNSTAQFIRYYKFIRSAKKDQLIKINNFGFFEAKNYFETEILNANSIHMEIFNQKLFDEKFSLGKLKQEKSSPNFYLAKIPSHSITTKQKLESFGFKNMDTIVYHVWKKDTLLKLGKCNNDKIKFARKYHANEVSKISKKAFADKNRILTRFTNDIMISSSHIGQLYHKWAYQSVMKKFADEVLIYLEKGKILGFLAYKTYKISKDDVLIMVGEITLNAVLLEHSGKGIYGQILLYCLQYLAQIGCDFVIIATQSNNYAVHKACSKTGSYLDSVISSFHLWIKN